MDTLTGYKVIRQDRSSYAVRNKVLERYYKPKTYVSASRRAIKLGYGLLIFRDQQSARDFYSSEGVTGADCYFIAPVRFSRLSIMPLPWFRIDLEKLNRDTDLEYMKLLADGESLYSGMITGWPLGTLMVKRLYVVE